MRLPTRKDVLPITAILACVVPLAGCASLMEALESIETAGTVETSTPTDGLREALSVGTGRAVESLSRVDGYLLSELVRIAVPEKLEPLAKALEVIGRDDVVDEFVTSLNRAAEAAAPVARNVFMDSIRAMTFDDAIRILRGEQHEATDYFREKAGPRLAELFRPIVDEKLDAVGATRSFNELVDEASRLPLIRRPPFDLGEYVTGRALDGLFLVLAREEVKIRRDPVARTTELLRKWFGQG